MHNIKISSLKLKFGDKEIDKKEFYSSKEAILLDSVDLSKIVASSKWKINDTTYKYFCRYLNNDVIQPLKKVHKFILTTNPFIILKHISDVSSKLYALSSFHLYNIIHKNSYFCQGGYRDKLQ